MKAMISVGDTVKVTGKTIALDENGDEMLKELIPIGTICTVTAIEEFRGKEYYEVTSSVAEDGFLSFICCNAVCALLFHFNSTTSAG